MTGGLGTFLFFWRYIWVLYFFFFLHGKISFFTSLTKFFLFQLDLYTRFQFKFLNENRSLDLFWKYTLLGKYILGIAIIRQYLTIVMKSFHLVTSFEKDEN